MLDDSDKQQRGSTSQKHGTSGVKTRSRTSTACCTCRERRIRCVVPPGEKTCTYCDQYNIQCVILDTDERKRPTSKAYTSTLTNRIQLLEKMLIERGTKPPPVVYPPKTKNWRSSSMLEQPETQRMIKRTKLAQSQTQYITQNEIQQAHTTRNTQPEVHIIQDIVLFDHTQSEFGCLVSHLPVFETDAPTPPRNADLIDKLLSNKGHLGVDPHSGQERYYGSTSNCHVYSESLAGLRLENNFKNPRYEEREPLERFRRTAKIIRSLPQDTHDYLMDSFFQKYNAVLPVVHESMFYEGRDQGLTQYYSGFLHICILAIGYRFADKNREDIKRLSGPEGQKQESTVHREAKFMLDTELERPGGITSIQALLLLGELEAGVGRDNTGWMYGGMACRLAFDIGLHLDSRRMGLPERDIEIRDMTLWACICSDKYWALYLGRPTSMKKSDMPEIYQATKNSARLGNCLPCGPDTVLITQTYEALLDLMALAGRTTELNGHIKSSERFDYELYAQLSALDAELKNWRDNLPPELLWNSENIKNAPLAFFLLHQQYHCAMILLHRPFTLYPAVVTTKSPGGPSHTEEHTVLSTISRKSCTSHAIQVAKISAEHRRRFGENPLFFSGIQHLGTAATSLIGSLLHTRDPEERKEHMRHLECLAAALSDMVESYKPAEAVSNVLKAVMAELREPSANSPGSKSSPSTRGKIRNGGGMDEGDGHMSDLPITKMREYSFGLQNTIGPHSYDALHGFVAPDLMFSSYLSLDHTIT